VFIGGFGANSLAYDAQLYELARRGRKVIYLNPLEGLAGSEEEQTYAKDTGIPGIIQNKASEVSRLLKELGIARVDVVGHSQGGAVATLLAATHPDMVKKLVLDTPAGLVGQKTSAELITRSLDEAASEYVYARKKMEDDGDTSYLKEWKERLFHDKRGNLSRFLWRLKNEIESLAKTDITPLLDDIQHGVNRKNEETVSPEVILLTANNDRIFRSEEIEKTLGINSITQTGTDGIQTGRVNSWTMYADKNTGHGFLTKNDPELMADLTGHKRIVADGGKASVIADCLAGKSDLRPAA
jgi:pimeloyl-ACP methyl ester carboxylesterase